MTTALSPEGSVQQALALLQQDQPPEGALALLQDIAEGQPCFAQAQHVRAICALRQGDPGRAKHLLLDAMRRGERNGAVLLRLAHAAAATGMPDDALAALLDSLKHVPGPKLFPFTLQLLQALEFANRQRTASKDRVFEALLLPFLAALLERRDMEGALRLERLIYQYYVKSTETEAHFAWCTERTEPLFAEAGHYWRQALAPLPQPALAAPYRVGFFVHSASMLAHVEVLLNFLKGHRLLDAQPFEPTVYCFSGKDAAMERALCDLGVRLVMLNERFPETEDSSWERLLRLRELLAQEGVHQLVWVSMVSMMALAFGMRIAPVQTWLAMKYRNFSNPDIDGYVTGSALTRFGTLSGRRWRMAMLGVDDWCDPTLEREAAEIRASLKAEVVLMTLARTEKMRDPAYLSAVASILKAHPEAMFLWAGRVESPEVVAAFTEAGVVDRTRFIGWVNTRLYAQVADIFLDTFPFPCGFTLYQAMAAGKPVVIYDSPEAAQTGLWSFLKPVVEGQEGEAGERAELRALIGDEAGPLISLARTPDQFVRLAGRLVQDLDARALAGDAARRFMARYFSDPRVLGASMAHHFVELMEEPRAGQPA